MTPTRWLDDDEEHAWRALLRMQHALSARLNQELQRHSGLSSADYEVLVHLSEAPDGRLRANVLGRNMEWEKSRLSHHLTRMERRGLVRREECPSDARGAFAVITDSGRATIEAAAPRHLDDVRRWFVDRLSPEQLVAVGEAADLVLAGLHDDEDEEEEAPDPAASAGSG